MNATNVVGKAGTPSGRAGARGPDACAPPVPVSAMQSVASAQRRAKMLPAARVTNDALRNTSTFPLASTAHFSVYDAIVAAEDAVKASLRVEASASLEVRR